MITPMFAPECPNLHLCVPNRTQAHDTHTHTSRMVRCTWTLIVQQQELITVAHRVGIPIIFPHHNEIFTGQQSMHSMKSCQFEKRSSVSLNGFGHSDPRTSHIYSISYCKQRTRWFECQNLGLSDTHAASFVVIGVGALLAFQWPPTLG